MSFLSQEFEVSLDQVPEAFKEARTTLDEINARISESSSKLKQSEEELQSALDGVQTTRENMSLFLEVEGKLKARGLSLAKIDDIVNVISNVEKLDGDPAKMAAALAAVSSLQEQKEALEVDIKVKEEKARILEEKTAAISTQLATLSGIQAFLNEFEALGFTQDMLQELLAVVKDVAERRSLPVDLASAAFMTEVKAGYESVLGFKGVLENLQNRIKNTQALLNQAQTTYATLTDSVKAVNSLYSKGIEEKDLIYWQKIFRDHPHLTAEMLTTTLRDYADLLQAIFALQKIHKKLESEIEVLTRDIKAGYKEKARISAELEEAKRTADEEKRQLRENIEQLSKQAQQILFEVATDAGDKQRRRHFWREYLCRPPTPSCCLLFCGRTAALSQSPKTYLSRRCLFWAY
jgi:chromosome segregation ATPase